jgi:hypothetical protein
MFWRAHDEKLVSPGLPARSSSRHMQFSSHEKRGRAGSLPYMPPYSSAAAHIEQNRNDLKGYYCFPDAQWTMDPQYYAMTELFTKHGVYIAYKNQETGATTPKTFLVRS